MTPNFMQTLNTQADFRYWDKFKMEFRWSICLHYEFDIAWITAKPLNAKDHVAFNHVTTWRVGSELFLYLNAGGASGRVIDFTRGLG